MAYNPGCDTRGMPWQGGLVQSQDEFMAQNEDENRLRQHQRVGDRESVDKVYACSSNSD